jgi:hypothetical protein
MNERRNKFFRYNRTNDIIPFSLTMRELFTQENINLFCANERSDLSYFFDNFTTFRKYLKPYNIFKEDPFLSEELDSMLKSILEFIGYLVTHDNILMFPSEFYDGKIYRSAKITAFRNNNDYGYFPLEKSITCPDSQSLDYEPTFFSVKSTTEYINNIIEHSVNSCNKIKDVSSKNHLNLYIGTTILLE